MLSASPRERVDATATDLAVPNDEAVTVSVIVPCYNGARDLPACLEALQRQEWDGHAEIIVVDDASTDGTAAVAARLGARVIRNETNLGPAGARNLGAREARGRIFAFTDADCRPDPRWLSALVPLLGEGVAAVCGLTVGARHDSVLMRYLATNNQLLPLAHRDSGPRTHARRLADYARGLLTPPVPPEREVPRPVYSAASCNLAVDRAAFWSVGGFDAGFAFSGEDQDFCRRLCESHGVDLIFEPRALVRHDFKNSVRDTLRRSAAYAQGHMALREKGGEAGFLLFPIPLGVAALALAARRRPVLGLLSVAAIPAFYPRYFRMSPRPPLVDQVAFGYLNFLQEVAADAAVAQWLLRPGSGESATCG